MIDLYQDEHEDAEHDAEPQHDPAPDREDPDRDRTWGELRAAVQAADAVRLSAAMRGHFGRGIRRPPAEVAYAATAWGRLLARGLRTYASCSHDDLDPAELASLRAPLMLRLDDALGSLYVPDRVSSAAMGATPRHWCPLPGTGLEIPLISPELLRAEGMAVTSWALNSREWAWAQAPLRQAQEALLVYSTAWVRELVMSLCRAMQTHDPHQGGEFRILQQLSWDAATSRFHGSLSSLLAPEAVWGPAGAMSILTQSMLGMFYREDRPVPPVEMAAYHRELRKHLLMGTPDEVFLSAALASWAF